VGERLKCVEYATEARSKPDELVTTCTARSYAVSERLDCIREFAKK